MNSLLNQIHSDLLDHRLELSNILRKVIVLSRELQIPELRQWALRELEGYPSNILLPGYRRLKVNCIGKWTNGRCVYQNFNVPLSKIYDADLLESITNFYVLDGVRSLEKIVVSKENRFPLPYESVRLINEYTSENGYGFSEIEYPIFLYDFEQILDTLKNRLLDFVLFLENYRFPQAPTPPGPSGPPGPSKKPGTMAIPYHRNRYFVPKIFAPGELSSNLLAIFSHYTSDAKNVKIAFVKWSGDQIEESNYGAKFHDLSSFCDLSANFDLVLHFLVDLTHPTADDSTRVMIEMYGQVEIFEIRISSDEPIFIEELFYLLITKLHLSETRSPLEVHMSELTNKMMILFLAADPKDQVPLRLGEEIREIREKLNQAKLRDRFELEQRHSVRVLDVSEALLELNPKIVHFSGHGAKTGELCFEDLQGETLPISPESLADLFSHFRDTVECVILNACYSETQAFAIATYIHYVIGIPQNLNDKAAIAFAAGFYQSLGSGRSFYASYELGCTQIKLQGFSDMNMPIFIENGRVVEKQKPHQIVLAEDGPILYLG